MSRGLVKSSLTCVTSSKLVAAEREIAMILDVGVHLRSESSKCLPVKPAAPVTQIRPFSLFAKKQLPIVDVVLLCLRVIVHSPYIKPITLFLITHDPPTAFMDFQDQVWHV